MAEKVKITNTTSDLNQAILANAATEATLLRLVSLMESKQKGLGQQTLGVANKVIQGNIKAQKQSTSAFQSFTNTLGDGTKVSSKLFQTFSSIAGTTVGTTFSLLSTAGSTLLEFLKNGYTAFQDVSRSGASFNNNLLDLRKSAAEAAIPLDEFVGIIKQNSQTLTALGGTVTEGAKRFGQLSKEFRDSEFGGELTAMGYSIGEMNDLLADQLELDMRGGKLRGKDNATLRKETENYILELDKLTKVTGLSRDELQKGLKQAMKDGRVLTMQSRLSGDALTTFKNTMGMMNANIDPSLMGSLTQMMGGIIDPTDEFAKYLTMASPNVMAFEEALGKGQVSVEDQIKQYKQQSKEIESFLSQFNQQIINTNPGLQKLAQYNASIQNLIESNTGAARKEQQARESITTAFGKVEKAFNDIYNKFIEKLMDNPIFQQIIERLEQFASVINNSSDDILKAFDGILTTFNNSLGNFMQNIKTDGIIGAVIKFFGELFTGVKNNLIPVTMKIFQRMGEDPKLTAEREALKNMSPEEREQAIARNPRLAEELRTPQAGELPEMPDLFGPMVDGLKSLVSYIPSLTEFATFFGIAGGGSYVAGLGLAAGITEVGLALSGLAVELGGGLAAGLAALTPALAAISVPALAVGAAIGMGAGGLGFAFKGISSIIDAVSNSFTRIKDFFVGMEAVDSNKLASVGQSIKPLAEGVSTLASAGFATLLSGGGLVMFADSMQKFSNLDPEKIQSVGPALKALYEGVSVFRQGGILESISGAFSSFFTGGSIVAITETVSKLNSLKIDSNNTTVLVSFMDALSNISNINTQSLQTSLTSIKNILDTFQIDQTNVEKITSSVSAIGNLKTAIGDNFNLDATGVDNFNKSIQTLVESLSSLEDQMKKTSSTNVNVNTNENGRRAFPADIAGNSPEDLQKQLNMKIEELISHIVEMKQNTKDTADSLSDRRSAV